MKVQITLDVYSGLTNPSWVVDLDPAMVATITRRLAELPTTPVRLRCGLGYRGFIVRPIDRSDMPTAFRLNRGLVQVSRSQQVHIDREAWLERWALGTAPQGTDPFALQLVQRAIDSPTQPPPCETPTGPPPFDPSEWHTTEGLRNNCYNYVTRNLFTSGVATPGRKGGKSVLMGVPCENFSLRLVGDGLSPLSDRQEVFTKDHDPSVGWYAALFITESLDFHFYRLDGNAYWTHKAGPGCFVRGCDESGSAILRDRILTCDTLHYRFCDFFFVPNGLIVK